MKLPWSHNRPQLTFESELEDAKRKLKSLKFERDLLSQMILRVYESKDIEDEDKKYLLNKYKSSLKELESQINTYSAMVEVRELENAREELVNLFNSKISQIDKRIDELSKTVGGLSAVSQIKVEEQPIREKKEEKKDKPKVEKTEKEEDKLEELYKEVNTVLEKLEQIEIQ
ncbi:MAG: hypothetical protein JRN26_00215 [Nitrososphaerota archaeon]|jgi:uncharacterized phage infection (PIP) family protein YhgE|nr:hypothetical protein [Nitrososphaerota archaeon]MDG6928148.1 hypothetical protein [Nitrososphaerota archaeon]MDG6930987.1 hypothetical protein [Nitrososphaerota archaeon]MDG6932811.1 hypothetical protein [Nitrososphaerota archaeon]MDG6935306.1 hypothetical protein [Nitrososphaerota archaeon]